MGEVKEKLEARKRRAKATSLKSAKKWLSRGDLVEIATECGVTKQWISAIISDSSKDFAIAEKIIQKAEHNKALVERSQAL